MTVWLLGSWTDGPELPEPVPFGPAAATATDPNSPRRARVVVARLRMGECLSLWCIRVALATFRAAFEKNLSATAAADILFEDAGILGPFELERQARDH